MIWPSVFLGVTLTLVSVLGLAKFDMVPQIPKTFYSCTIESILIVCITTWYGKCSASDHKALQRVVCTAQYSTGAKPSRTYILGGVRGRPKELSKTSDSKDSSLCYCTASGTGVPSIGPKDSLTASTTRP
jgi:hypothetical protein